MTEQKLPKNEEKKEIQRERTDDLLDSMDTTILFRTARESEWEKRKNAWVDKHPYLTGYLFLSAIVTLLFATHLTTFVIAFLFLYLISDFLTNDVRRFVPFIPKALLFSILYVTVLALLSVLVFNVIPNFIKQLPGLAYQLQAQAIEQFDIANQRWNLTQYVNPTEVNKTIVSGTTKTLGFLVGRLSLVYMGFVYFVFALVVNLLLYHNIQKIDEVFGRRTESLMNFIYRFTVSRVRVFYFYFKRVMGGQIIISAINTVISAVVILLLKLPHPILLMTIVFFFGLFPVVGNIASNTVLTITAFVSIGTWGAGICLLLLIGIHKLEYFLNSKIIGEIVHLPMVITLTALVVAEVILGIIGLMLAIPLVLFARHEMEHIPGLSPKHEVLPKIENPPELKKKVQ